MKAAYRISASDIHRYSKDAKRAAATGKEICGLMLSDGDLITLVPVRNSAESIAAFQILPQHGANALNSRGGSAGQVIGAFHSHPWSSAEPGQSDIAGAGDKTLMLIFCVWNQEVKLWRIRKGAAKRVPLLVYKTGGELV